MSCKILIYNNKAKKFLDYHENEIENLNIRDIFLNEKDYDFFIKEIKNNHKLNNYRTFLVSKSKKKLDVKVTALEITQDNKLIGSILSFNLIS